MRIVKIVFLIWLVVSGMWGYSLWQGYQVNEHKVKTEEEGRFKIEKLPHDVWKITPLFKEGERVTVSGKNGAIFVEYQKGG